jgi:alpha-tubulin suppressor-like RCC1 family protein
MPPPTKQRALSQALRWHSSVSSACAHAGWGDNKHGQCGVKTNNSSKRTIQTPALIRDLPAIRKIVAGTSHALALSEEDEVFSWGNCAQGQTGQPGERSGGAGLHAMH